MTFTSVLATWATETKQNRTAIFDASVAELRDSVKFGSPVTGAPALPVAAGQYARAGALRDSVTVSHPDPHTALIYTTAPYAVDVEDQSKGQHFTNGGPHGWKLTVAGFSRVLESVTKRITGYGR